MASPPARVIDALKAVSERPGLLGFWLGDLTSARFLGKVGEDGSFDLRRARGLFDTPSLVFMRGSVEPSLSGSEVRARFRLHPYLQLYRWGVGLTFAVMGGLLATTAVRDPIRALVIVMTLGVIALLMLLPMFLMTASDKRKLRSEIEVLLRSVGPTTQG